MPLRRARSSARRMGGTREGRGEAGMEKPTTDEVGNDGLEVEGPASLAGWRSKDANDLLGTGGAAAGAGADGDTGGTGVGAVEADTPTGGVGTVVSREVGITAGGSVTTAGGTSWVVVGAMTAAVGSHDSDLDFTCEGAVPAAETEVLEESGETRTGGVSDTVETSVSEEATVSRKSCRGDSAGSEASLGSSSGATFVDEGAGGAAAAVLGGVAKGAKTGGFGDPGGVESLRALSRTSGGGRERGDMMIPGARDGSVGRRDHIAQPPNCCFEFGDLLCIIFVDADVDAGMGTGGGAGTETAGAGTWGVDGGDLETWPEWEGGSGGGGADGGEEEEFAADAFVVGSGDGSWGGSEGSVDSSVSSGSSGPSSILGGFGEGEIGDNAGGGGIDSCFGKGDINCWGAQFCW